MAATFRAADINAVGGTTSVTGDDPGATVGDTLWAFLTIRGTQSITAVPSGWTLYDSIDGGGVNDCILLVYTSTYVSGSTWTWTRSASTGGHAITIVAVYDDGGETPDAYAESDTGSGTTHDAATITVVADALQLAVCGWMDSAGDALSTPPSGYTEVADDNHTAGTLRAGQSVHWAQLGAGATGAKTITIDQTVSGVTMHVSISPAATSSGAAALHYYKTMAARSNAQ